jgi:hypothetical protein
MATTGTPATSVAFDSGNGEVWNLAVGERDVGFDFLGERAQAGPENDPDRRLAGPHLFDEMLRFLDPLEQPMHAVIPFSCWMSQ